MRNLGLSNFTARLGKGVCIIKEAVFRDSLFYFMYCCNEIISLRLHRLKYHSFDHQSKSI